MPSAEVQDGAGGKSVAGAAAAAGNAKKSGKSGKQKKASGKKPEAGESKANNKILVSELKLFQNSNLLNQRDPLEQLHRQINQLIQEDGAASNLARAPSARLLQQAAGAHHLELAGPPQQSLSATQMLQYNHQALQQQQQQQQVPLVDHRAMQYHPGANFVALASEQEVFTVKKGVLWQQQQNRERFHQRLFSRWKKRYFILTTDYLVCFKRSTARVGRSEMGAFLYKIALTDVAKTEWLRPKRADKGAIVLEVRDSFNLFLWSKKELDEWMLLLKETIERIRLRRGNHAASNGFRIQTRLAMPSAQGNGFDQGVYENASAPKNSSGDTTSQIGRFLGGQAGAGGERESARDMTLNSQTKGSSRASSGSRRPATSSTGGSNGAAPDPMGHEMQGARHATGRRDESRGQAESAPPSSAESVDGGASRPSAVQLASNARGSSKQSRALAARDNGGGGVVNAEAEGAREDCSLNQQRVKSERQIPTNGVAGASLREQTDADEDICAADASGRPEGPDGAHRTTTERPPGRRAGGNSERPAANLIRRDDSWQSLVSLTHVGKPTGNAQAGQQEQSLGARHIIGPNDRPDAGHQAQRQRAINIESTATPLRHRLPARQHSIQSYSRRVAPMGRQLPLLQQHAHSFDVPAARQIPSSPSLHGAQQQTPSHHQRLLQLQLLHNSNNVDYIRANNGALQQRNDYQIYAPESVATSNHYGYYSMRSNLKSAASEFSFIRPSSSSFQQAAAAAGERPLHPALAHDGPTGFVLGPRSVEACLAPAAVGQNCVPSDYNNNSNYPTGLVRPLDGSESFQQAYGNAAAPLQRPPERPMPLEAAAAAAAPNRDLPLKPNRKRVAATANESRLEKSSLGSSIACFFRRAFSRRSKRRPKLVESCSSSLAAFDSNLDQVQVAQSAFSTGSKSARAERGAGAGQPSGQPQRMIDLIEAFASKTALDHTHAQPGLAMQAGGQNGAEQQFGSIRPKFIRDQVGSPLHKSNSVSTSFGLGGSNELAYRNQRLADGERDQMSSPLITRSTKVMSANLTPLFAHKRAPAFDQAGADELMSPRNVRQMPRPSSIYGQPSLIGSPVISSGARNGAGAGGDNFGLHRSSVHGASGAHRERAQNMDFRRQRTINAPFLDTTREVAEEVSSPTADLRELLPKEQLYDHEINARLSYNHVQDSSLLRSSGIDAYYRHQRQAVVNPILQSPTMSAIYDNHATTPAHRLSELAGQHHSTAHYDDYRPASFHDPDRDASGYSRPRIMAPAARMSSQTFEALASPLMQQGGRMSHSSSGHNQALYTPTREAAASRQNGQPANGEDNRVFVRSKPAAIVAPTTPLRQSNYAPQTQPADGPTAPGGFGMRFIGQASPMRAQQHQQQQQQAAPNGVAVSPVAARRGAINQAQQPQYQQSPLVDEQTRILKRGGRTQTTIIASDHSDSVKPPPPPQPQPLSGPVSARARAADPSEATSPPRAAGTDAASPAGADNPGARRELRSKTSSSRSDAAIENTTDCSSDGRESSDKRTPSGSSQEEEEEPKSSLAGSGSSNSSVSRNSPRSSSIAMSGNDLATRVSPPARDDAVKPRGHLGRLTRADDGQPKSRLANGKRRGSSTEHSDELTSQTGSIDEPDEKNWVNSKLAQ